MNAPATPRPADPSPSPGDDGRAILPTEARSGRGWLVRCVRTLGALLVHPRSRFATCPEPIEHGRVLGFLATLRLPPWLLLVAILVVRSLWADGFPAVSSRPVYEFLPMAFARAFSTWLLVMVPIGLPLLYFVVGLLAHIGIGLTGGASRSIGASMRATGYALGPSLLALALVELPLQLGSLPGWIYASVLGVAALSFAILGSIALAQTHRISARRTVLVLVVPLLLFVAVSGGRAALDLATWPGFPPPSTPFDLP